MARPGSSPEGRRRKDAIHKALLSAHALSWPVLTSLTEQDFTHTVYSHGEERWSVRDLVSHLADAEKGLLGQVQRLVQGATTVPDGFDLARWNRGAVRKRASLPFADLLEELLTTHHAVLRFVDEVGEDQLDLRGRAGSGETLSAEGFLRRIADHRRAHVLDLARALTAVDLGHPAPIHDLFARRLLPQAGPIGSTLGILDEETQLLRRLGLVQWLRTGSETEPTLRVRTVADEVWVLLAGHVEFLWRDDRQDSPTFRNRHRLVAFEPILVLAPFGVAFGHRVLEGEAFFVRLATHSDSEEPDGHVLPWEEKA